MPRKNYTSKKSPSPTSPPKKVMVEKTRVIDKVIIYAIFLVFKLINYLTRLLPNQTIADSNVNEEHCAQIQISNESIISVSLPKNFDSAIRDYGILDEEVQFLKKVNTDLKKKLKNIKHDYDKCMKNLESANAKIYKYNSSKVQTCKNCEAIDDEGRSKISKALQQVLVKFEHLRLKCQYGVEDLKKVCGDKIQNAHARDIAAYHISSLEQFVQWLDMKTDNIQKFDNYIKHPSNIISVADILNHADLNDVISTMHIGLMHFFKKYFVLLSITISDKEYIESSIYTQSKYSTEAYQEKMEESTQTFSASENPAYNENTGAEHEQITDFDFLEKHGKYNNLYTFLLNYLDFEPKILIKCMIQVKKNNNGTFHNLTVFDIANRVEQVYRQHM